MLFFFFFLEIDGKSRLRVAYQQGLTCLVFRTKTGLYDCIVGSKVMTLNSLVWQIGDFFQPGSVPQTGSITIGTLPV